MKVIEDWIDKNIENIFEDFYGFMDLSEAQLLTIAQLLAQDRKSFAKGLIDFCEDAYLNIGSDGYVSIHCPSGSTMDYVYHLADQHHGYYRSKMDDFSSEYAQQQAETNRVMQSCQ